jgi:hypothetical protein
MAEIGFCVVRVRMAALVGQARPVRRSRSPEMTALMWCVARVHPTVHSATYRACSHLPTRSMLSLRSAGRRSLRLVHRTTHMVQLDPNDGLQDRKAGSRLVHEVESRAAAAFLVVAAHTR